MPTTKKCLFPANQEVKVSRTKRSYCKLVMCSWANASLTWIAWPPTIKELKQCIIVEAAGRNRPYMLKRLIARLHTTERQDLYKRLGL